MPEHAAGNTRPLKFVKPGIAEKHFGVDRRTLRAWAAAGLIRSFQAAPGLQHLYDISITSIAPSEKEVRSDCATERLDCVYARVSTRKQLDDLQRQLDELKLAHPGAVVFSDCASGLNFKRKGLQAILQLAFEGRLRHVYVAHKDRLCRFAYDLVEHVLEKHGAKVVVDASDDDTASSGEADLADDILSVVTVFGARLYGRRSGRKRQRATKEGEVHRYDDGNVVRGASVPPASVA